MLKVRDTLNTVEGYQEIIDNNIEFSMEDAVNLETSDDEQYINDIKLSLFKYSLKILQAKYSQGRPIEELKPVLFDIIEYSTTIWDQSFAYVQMVWMLSIGIMLEIEDEEFNKLITLVKAGNPNDYLIDQLIKYRKADWNTESTDFKFPKPYMKIKNVFELALTGDKARALEMLSSYVDKAWYKGHSDMSWYDNHKSKFNIHVGYWSFESGAIAKILGLNDTGLKDHRYYPYDLVNYKS